MFQASSAHLQEYTVVYMQHTALSLSMRVRGGLLVHSLLCTDRPLRTLVESDSAVCCMYDMIYLLTAIGLTLGGSSTVHIYTQTVHRTTQNKQYIEEHNSLWECGPCPILARFILAFALQLRKKHGKTSVRVAASKNT